MQSIHKMTPRKRELQLNVSIKFRKIDKKKQNMQGKQIGPQHMEKERLQAKILPPPKNKKQTKIRHNKTPRTTVNLKKTQARQSIGTATDEELYNTLCYMLRFSV